MMRAWIGGVLAAVVLGGSALGAQAEAPAPKVVATIKPVHALVLQVMGETASPTLIVSGAASPHSYALKPSDAKAIADADIVFRVSEALEPFTVKALKNLGKSTSVVSLLDAPGVALLKARNDPNFERHAHAKADRHGHDHDHAKAESGIDGHMWLDPANAVAMVDHIAERLAAKDPSRADVYKSNAAKAKEGIGELAKDLEASLKPVAGRPYVVFHDAYQYFEARFGLTPVGAVTINPEVPPSGKRLATLRDKIRLLGASCIFSEPNFEAKVVKAIAEGSNVRAAQLDPEAATLQPGPNLYATMMRNMAQSMRACLLPAS